MDKQVGELWDDIKTRAYGSVECDLMESLIRKLIEETTQRIHAGRLSGPTHGEYSSCLCEREALIKYGIDPETWK